MDADAVADQRDRLHDLVQADEPDVGAAEPGMRHAGAGDVKRLEAGALGDQRGECIIDASRHQNGRAAQADRQCVLSVSQSRS